MTRLVLAAGAAVSCAGFWYSLLKLFGAPDGLTIPLVAAAGVVGFVFLILLPGATR